MALVAGISASDFWELTPYQSNILTKSYIADSKMRAVWNAVYPNAKTLPDFGEILGLERRPHSFEELLKQFDSDFE